MTSPSCTPGVLVAMALAAGCASAPPASTTVVAFSDVHFDPFHDPLLFPELLAAPASDWARIFARSGSTDPGCRADLVVLQARDVVEAIRLRAARLFVLRSGKVVSRTPPATARLDLPGRPAEVDFLAPRRQAAGT